MFRPREPTLPNVARERARESERKRAREIDSEKKREREKARARDREREYMIDRDFHKVDVFRRHPAFVFWVKGLGFSSLGFWFRV